MAPGDELSPLSSSLLQYITTATAVLIRLTFRAYCYAISFNDISSGLH
jgi:hypothetical protein